MNRKTLPFSLINILLGVCCFLSCDLSSSVNEKDTAVSYLPVTDSLSSAADNKKSVLKVVKTGAEQTHLYVAKLKGKKVAVVANNTSYIKKTHLVDSMLSLGVQVVRVFSPEHGFRGDQDAGAKVRNDIDQKTQLPIVSLYGNSKKPSVSSLKNIDVVVFDLQDVGVRFYTYISTLHYVMEACAENKVDLIVLDRPNPNAHYISGPVLQQDQKSFVGMHPVPVVYGMSIGEYALMINGEGWLKDSIMCKLEIIELENWTHNTEYILPIPPSPNLSTQRSIYLYPNLCLFEGTCVSVGRGTVNPFEKYGHPNYQDSSYSFVPVSVKGKSLNPPFKGQECFGKDLSGLTLEEARAVRKFDLSYLQDALENTKVAKFFTSPSFFNLLAGNSALIKQLKKGVSIAEIEEGWIIEINDFKKIRLNYLKYK